MLKFVEKNTTIYENKEKIWKGPVLKPFYDRNCSFGQIAFEELRRRSNEIFLISDSENRRLTNEELCLQAIRIAKGFKKHNVRQSDIIGIAGQNTINLIVVVLACFFSGSAYHAINPNSDKKNAKHNFNITKPKLIFCDGQDLEKIRYASSDFRTKIFTLNDHFKSISSVVELLQPTGDEHEYQPAELEKGTMQNMAILCSSGSTGLPKAVKISHLHRMWDVTNFLTKNDIQYMISTADWISSLFCLIGGLVYGSKIIISKQACTPEYFLDIVQKYKITTTLKSPPAMTALVKCALAIPDKLQTIRYLLFGGSKATTAIQNSMNNLLHNGCIVHLYGFTELNTIFTRHFNFIEKPNSCGLLLPGMQARIVNDSGQNLGPNKIGEILCHHGEKWEGYYGNVKATAEMFDEEGWFHTGDLGYFDNDNYLYIVDRKKELLKYNGMHYYPNQIEDVIAQIPDVKEVCVFGIFNELHGDEAAAAVVEIEGSNLNAEDVVSYVRQHIEVDYMHLNGGCKLFDAIPKTSNGKIDRKATKAAFSAQPRIFKTPK